MYQRNSTNQNPHLIFHLVSIASKPLSPQRLPPPHIANIPIRFQINNKLYKKATHPVRSTHTSTPLPKTAPTGKPARLEEILDLMQLYFAPFFNSAICCATASAAAMRSAYARKSPERWVCMACSIRRAYSFSRAVMGSFLKNPNIACYFQGLTRAKRNGFRNCGGLCYICQLTNAMYFWPSKQQDQPLPR